MLNWHPIIYIKVRMIFGTEVTQRATKKGIKNHRENYYDSLCGSLFLTLRLTV